MMSQILQHCQQDYERLVRRQLTSSVLSDCSYTASDDETEHHPSEEHTEQNSSMPTGAHATDQHACVTRGRSASEYVTGSRSLSEYATGNRSLSEYGTGSRFTSECVNDSRSTSEYVTGSRSTSEYESKPGYVFAAKPECITDKKLDGVTTSRSEHQEIVDGETGVMEELAITGKPEVLNLKGILKRPGKPSLHNRAQSLNDVHTMKLSEDIVDHGKTSDAATRYSTLRFRTRSLSSDLDQIPVEQKHATSGRENRVFAHLQDNERGDNSQIAVQNNGLLEQNGEHLTRNDSDDAASESVLNERKQRLINDAFGYDLTKHHSNIARSDPGAVHTSENGELTDNPTVAVTNGGGPRIAAHTHLESISRHVDVKNKHLSFNGVDTHRKHSEQSDQTPVYKSKPPSSVSFSCDSKPPTSSNSKQRHDVQDLEDTVISLRKVLVMREREVDELRAAQRDSQALIRQLKDVHHGSGSGAVQTEPSTAPASASIATTSLTHQQLQHREDRGSRESREKSDKVLQWLESPDYQSSKPVAKHHSTAPTGHQVTQEKKTINEDEGHKHKKLSISSKDIDLQYRDNTPDVLRTVGEVLSQQIAARKAYNYEADVEESAVTLGYEPIHKHGVPTGDSLGATKGSIHQTFTLSANSSAPQSRNHETTSSTVHKESAASSDMRERTFTAPQHYGSDAEVVSLRKTIRELRDKNHQLTQDNITLTDYIHDLEDRLHTTLLDKEQQEHQHRAPMKDTRRTVSPSPYMVTGKSCSGLNSSQLDYGEDTVEDVIVETQSSNHQHLQQQNRCMEKSCEETQKHEEKQTHCDISEQRSETEEALPYGDTEPTDQELNPTAVLETFDLNDKSTINILQQETHSFVSREGINKAEQEMERIIQDLNLDGVEASESEDEGGALKRRLSWESDSTDMLLKQIPQQPASQDFGRSVRAAASGSNHEPYTTDLPRYTSTRGPATTTRDSKEHPPVHTDHPPPYTHYSSQGPPRTRAPHSPVGSLSAQRTRPTAAARGDDCTPPHGYRSVLPKPIVSQHNKHAVTQRSSIDPTCGKRPLAPSVASDIHVGDTVKFSRQGGKISRGLVCYVGRLPAKNDTYIGVELEHELGTHDGVYEGQRYFQCKQHRGVFVSFSKIVMAWTDH